MLASDLYGLSFNRTCKSTIRTLKFSSKGTHVRVAYWIDKEICVIPAGLVFKVDPDDDTHYFLAAIEEMIITQLIIKLQMVGQRMAVMDSLASETCKA